MQVLTPSGMVLITLKDGPPYCRWNIADLANGTNLSLLTTLPFNIKEWHGYAHVTTDPSAVPLDPGRALTYVFTRNNIDQVRVH
jgi:hypothetical protein